MPPMYGCHHHDHPLLLRDHHDGLLCDYRGASLLNGLHAHVHRPDAFRHALRHALRHDGLHACQQLNRSDHLHHDVLRRYAMRDVNHGGDGLNPSPVP